MAFFIPFALSSSLYLWSSFGSSEIEDAFRNHKEMPQYKYLSRPVYKLVAFHSNPVVATAISFFVTDLVMHQMPTVLLNSLINRVFKTDYNTSFSPGFSLAWAALGLPVMYAKYKNLHKISK